MFWTRNWQATSTVLTSSSLRIPEIVITGVVGIIEVIKASVERPVPVLHHLFSQFSQAMFFNYPIISPLFSRVDRIFIALLTAFWEDNVVWFVFAKRFDELGIWKIFSIELFQMLAIVCRLVNLYVISLQN